MNQQFSNGVVSPSEAGLNAQSQTVAAQIIDGGSSSAQNLASISHSQGQGSTQLVVDVFTILCSRNEMEAASDIISALSRYGQSDTITLAFVSACQLGYSDTASMALAQAYGTGNKLTLVDASVHIVEQGYWNEIAEFIAKAIQDDQDLTEIGYILARIISNGVNDAEFVQALSQVAKKYELCVHMGEAISKAQLYENVLPLFMKYVGPDKCLTKPMMYVECPLATCFRMDGCCDSQQHSMGEICYNGFSKGYEYIGQCTNREGKTVSVWDPQFGLACHC
eukprot:TRINITY_DN2902_c0_g1_i2.p2 TRINITY_DN2902_c0_g1~~TRINITY_DN2902_c0_g1_i2.p2  ORF type:complete len:280 (-),score=25.12 TRINITY_DN2902_c0_g1_i2:785-1624(-)